HSDQIDKLYYFDNKVVAWAQGYDSQMQPAHIPAAFSIFHAGRWQNYSEENTSSLKDIADITSVTYSSRNDMLFLGTLGGEVLSWQPNGAVSFPFQTLPFAGESITTMSTDLDGKILFNIYNANNQLYAFEESTNEWSSRTLGGGSALTEILTADFQRLWLWSKDYVLVADRNTTGTQILNNSNNNLIGGG